MSEPQRAPQPAQQDSGADPPRRIPLTLSKKIFSISFATALLALVVLAIRRSPAEIFSSFRNAQPAFLVAGFLLNILAFGVRAFRFNLLLLPADRIPFATAWSLSGATTFLLQVMPFRSGEIASWASIRTALGASWARSAAVLALVKLLDTATLLLAGLAGAAWLLFARGTHALGFTVAGLVFLGTGLLLALPLAGGRLLASLVPRLPEGGRRQAIAREVAEGLSVARREPGSYALAAAGAGALPRAPRPGALAHGARTRPSDPSRHARGGALHVDRDGRRPAVSGGHFWPVRIGLRRRCGP